MKFRYVNAALLSVLAPAIGMAARPGPARASSETVLYAFQGTAKDGASPAGDLIKVGGTLYGTASGLKYCGRFENCGVVFKLKLKPGSAAHVIHTFTRKAGFGPDSGLLDVAGTLYGTTNYGGGGTCHGPYKGCGTLYAITTPADGYSTVLDYSLATGFATGGLVRSGGTLYGVTQADYYDTVGSVYSITPAGALTVIYSFNDNGADGYAPIAAPTVLNGTLYGTTFEGGAHGYGTVYAIAPNGTETILHSFASTGDGAYPQGKLLSLNGNLYGTTQGSGYCTMTTDCATIFQITPSGTLTTLHVVQKADGLLPNADLTVVHGIIYGTTQYDAKSDYGTIFSVTTAGDFTTLYTFKGGSDGATPIAGLTAAGDTLYGTTYYGGAAGQGTVFQFSP